MAVLSEAQRQRVWRGAMRLWSKEREVVSGLTKQDIRDAVEDTDQWIEDNQSSFNTALPAAAQANLTLDQKTMLFMGVAAMRANLAFAKQLFGEMD